MKERITEKDASVGVYLFVIVLSCFYFEISLCSELCKLPKIMLW